ncbi:N-6 DNA methylase [Desulfobacterales bacterium HSG2]|nr:N-6 DNA methylase [Desulfobacterales bacterium HSG2]
MLKKSLEKIDFNPDNGLVFCNKLEGVYVGELCHIQEKAGKLGATAVLFRRKYNENNKIADSKPVLHIYEKENNFYNSQEHKDLHAKIWSAGEIEVYFIISETRIDIFNARKPAEVKNEKKLSLENLCLVSEALKQFNDQRFSAMVFGKGVFWEQEDFFDNKKDNFFRNQLREENTPFHRLLKQLMAVRDYLYDKQKKLSEETIDKLLIICILIKFLEEIKDDNGKHTLRNIYKKLKVKNFAEALLKGKCVSVLDELASKLEGNIFDNFEYKEKQEIQQADLKLVAAFLKAELDIAKKQYFLWKQYSFNHLPIELISSVYENFLPKEKGVVYTPPFLVNFLVDEVMPLDKAEEYFSRNKFKVLDPSCGSGVFLVAAYKRMLQWWSVNHYTKTQEIKFAKKNICQKILEKNIFGVDINETATRITIFSLTIALLDKLDPKEIWNNLKLNSLKSNIQTQNFFKWAADKNKKFDLVIGNPPFNDEKGRSTHKIKPELVSKIGFKHKKVAGNRFALQFFEGGMALAKKAFLILPSNVLLYNKSAQTYREQIFKDFTIEKIFDFTHLRRELFGSADTPVCAVLASPTESKGNAIEHTVIKRTVSSKKKIAFEIDHYDRHFVGHDWASDEKKQFIWKTNLLGGGRLFHLIYRLNLLENLDTFIKNKMKKNNWVYSNGYIGQHGDIDKNKQAIFLNGQPQIKAKTFDEFGSFEKEIIPINAYFWNTRTAELYQSPHIIFKLVLEKSKIPMAFSDEYLCFNSSFVGIHAPRSDRDELYRIYDRLHKNENTSKLYRVFILSTSSKVKVYHETSIVKEDIDNLPYPDKTEYLIPSLTEEILINDILDYYIHLGKSISEKGKGRKLHEKVSKKQLERFGKTFCDVINPMHAENGMSWQIGNVYQTPKKTFIVYQFVFGVQKQAIRFKVQEISVDDLDKNLNNILFNDKENRAALFNRVTRIYGSQDVYDYLILIKPTTTRYWLNSIAVRDADETVLDYYEAGY